MVFTLLIYFAVTTSLNISNRGEGLNLQLPSAKTGAKTEFAMTLYVDQYRNLFLDKRPIPLELVQSTIRELTNQNPNLQLTFSADKRTPYEFIMLLLDDIRQGGCFNIVLEVKRPKVNDNETKT